jgi:hypothetical protein
MDSSVRILRFVKEAIALPARTTPQRGPNPPVRRPLIENVPVNVLVEIDADHRKETKLIQELSATISLFNPIPEVEAVNTRSMPLPFCAFNPTSEKLNFGSITGCI